MNELDVNGNRSELSEPKKKRFEWLRKLFQIILTVVLLITIAGGAYFLILNQTNTLVVVVGDSMYPTLHDKEFGLMSTKSKHLDNIERDDIIIFYDLRHEAIPDKIDNLSEEQLKTIPQLIKRVIALPNETIQFFDGGNELDTIQITKADGAIFTYENNFPRGYYVYKENENGSGAPFELGNDEYFVLGDNLSQSLDSRSANIGAVNKSIINGVLYVIQGTSTGSDAQGRLTGKQYYMLWNWRYFK